MALQYKCDVCDNTITGHVTVLYSQGVPIYAMGYHPDKEQPTQIKQKQAVCHVCEGCLNILNTVLLKKITPSKLAQFLAMDYMPEGENGLHAILDVVKAERKAKGKK